VQEFFVFGGTLLHAMYFDIDLHVLFQAIACILGTIGIVIGQMYIIVVHFWQKRSKFFVHFKKNEITILFCCTQNMKFQNFKG